MLHYTDGLVERRDASIEQGLDWLVNVATSAASTRTTAGVGTTDTGLEPASAGSRDRTDLSLDLDGLCDTLLEQVGEQVEDDIALLALRVLPSAPFPAREHAVPGT